MYTVGQKVVCVETHVIAKVKKGEEYIIKAMRQCICGRVLIDVGVKTSNEMECGNGHGDFNNHGVFWIYSFKFSPLQEQSNFAEESLKEARIQQLEHRLEYLEELIKHPERNL